MADAYGMVTFSKSDDCNFDSEKLKKCLNQFEWDNTGAKWCISNSGNLYLDEYGFDRPQYPTAIPKEVQMYELFDRRIDGKVFFNQKSPEQMAEDDWDLVAGSIDAPIPLERLSGILSSLLKSGWIEIACVANEKSRYVYFEVLRIYADGRAYSKNHISGPFVKHVSSFEEYFPCDVEL